MGNQGQKPIKTKQLTIKKILVLVTTIALAFASTVPASYSQTASKTNQDRILNYVYTTFANDHSINASSVKIISSNEMTLYGHTVFVANVQLTTGEKQVPFYLDVSANKTYAYYPPTFSQITGLKMSYDLWNKLKNADPQEELSLIVSLKVPGLQSVSDRLPYDKINSLNTLGQEVKQQMVLTSEGGKTVDSALRQKMADLKSQDAKIASEIESISNNVQINNEQMINPVVQNAVAKLKQVDGVQVMNTLDLIPVISIKTTASSISQILELPNVEEIILDEKSSPSLAISAPTIGANAIWASGNAGSGVKTAVLDTGISGSPYLSVCMAHDSTGSGNVVDQNGHGTAVAGIIASTHATLRGVSYNACLMNAKIAESDGGGTLAWMEDGAQWAINNGAFVIEHSRNIPDLRGGGTDAWTEAVDYYVDHYGVIWSNSAGNNGTGDTTTQVTVPGDAYNTITVGAMDDKNTTSRSDDTLASFSRVCCTLDNRDKPDIVAPGAHIRTTTNTGSFATWSGTSFAAPHVAGVSSLLKYDRPSMTQLLAKAVILNAVVYDTATGAYDLGRGWGYLQALQAWQDDFFTDSSSISNRNDVYRYINANAGDKIAVTLTWNRHMTDASTVKGVSDLDLYLYSPSGTVIGSSTSSLQNVETVYATAPVSGKYKVDISGFDVPSSIGVESYALASNLPLYVS